MKIIIVGAGDVGFHLAKKLSEENQDVLLIESDPDGVSHLHGDCPSHPGILAKTNL